MLPPPCHGGMCLEDLALARTPRPMPVGANTLWPENT
jgi:hypothetical protein